MNNYGNNRNSKQRLNRKHKSILDNKPLFLTFTAILYIIFVIDEVVDAHTSVFVFICTTLAFLAVVIGYLKPGKFSMKAHDYGFWNALANTVLGTLLEGKRKNNRGRSRNRRRY